MTHIGESYRVVNGVTTCKIWEKNQNGEHLFVGWSECSTKDRYNKEIGRKLSLRRALKDGGFLRSERERIWEAYFNRLATPARKENGHAHAGVGSGS